MHSFKRNQVEEAIARYFGRSEPDTEQLTRTKRLLDTDRKLDPPRPANLEGAFYSDEGPGRGNEVFFSEYEAFALLLGLRLLNHNWPQKTVVRLLRDARGKLAATHRWIMQADPEVIFDPAEIEKLRRKSHHAITSTITTFLLVVSDSEERKQIKTGQLETHIFHDPNKAFAYTLERGGSSTWLELATPAHKLSIALANTSPTKRGRS